MEIYKVTVQLDGRDVIVLAKQGIMGSIETGRLKEGIKIPEYKVDMIIGRTAEGAAAWLQVSHPDNNGNYVILNQGWIRDGKNQLEPTMSLGSLRASITSIDSVDERVLKCQGKVEFGTTKCCTAYGVGCYIKCCAACCSDPTKCPGASCCA